MTVRRATSIALAFASPFMVAAQKPVLVPDISARQVQIRYSFSGAQLLLFGAIAYPDGRAPTRPADIAVVLRGPVQPILLREKQKIAGIWMNADSGRFRSAPSYYAVASSRPIHDLVDDRTASIYELGIHNLQLSPGGGSLPERERHFEAGLLDLRSRQGLYSESPRGVEITDGIRRGVLSLPHGWGHDRPGTGQQLAAGQPGVNVNQLNDGSLLDPLSGTAVLNGVPVTVGPS